MNPLFCIEFESIEQEMKPHPSIPSTALHAETLVVLQSAVPPRNANPDGKQRAGLISMVAHGPRGNQCDSGPPWRFLDFPNETRSCA